MANLPKGGASDWTPTVPTSRYEKLLQPGARERTEVVNAKNEQKQFVGKNGAQSEPLGRKGRCF